jgi:hypothetical protein
MQLMHILWRRLDQPGHDACWLEAHGSGWRLSGTAVFLDGRRPCSVAYHVECDGQWHTVGGELIARVGADRIEVSIVPTADHRWFVNGDEQAAAAGCIDLDFGLTPATNLVQLRRLALDVGSEAPAPAAWLEWPDLSLQRLEQTYRRTGEQTYWYESPDVPYAGELRVNDAGFIVSYPHLWVAEGTR